MSILNTFIPVIIENVEYRIKLSEVTEVIKHIKKNRSKAHLWLSNCLRNLKYTFGIMTALQQSNVFAFIVFRHNTRWQPKEKQPLPPPYTETAKQNFK